MPSPPGQPPPPKPSHGAHAHGSPSSHPLRADGGVVVHRPFHELEEEYGFTSAELRGYKQHFQNLDLDHDGRITHVDLMQLFRRMGVHFTGANIDELVSEVDLNHSGSVEFDEFVRLMYRLKKGGSSNWKRLLQATQPSLLMSARDATARFFGVHPPTADPEQQWQQASFFARRDVERPVPVVEASAAIVLESMQRGASASLRRITPTASPALRASPSGQSVLHSSTPGEQPMSTSPLLGLTRRLTQSMASIFVSPSQTSTPIQSPGLNALGLHTGSVGSLPGVAIDIDGYDSDSSFEYYSDDSDSDSDDPEHPHAHIDDPEHPHAHIDVHRRPLSPEPDVEHLHQVEHHHHHHHHSPHASPPIAREERIRAISPAPSPPPARSQSPPLPQPPPQQQQQQQQPPPRSRVRSHEPDSHQRSRSDISIDQGGASSSAAAPVGAAAPPAKRKKDKKNRERSQSESRNGPLFGVGADISDDLLPLNANDSVHLVSASPSPPPSHGSLGHRQGQRAAVSIPESIPEVSSRPVSPVAVAAPRPVAVAAPSRPAPHVATPPPYEAIYDTSSDGLLPAVAASGGNQRRRGHGRQQQNALGSSQEEVWASATPSVAVPIPSPAIRAPPYESPLASPGRPPVPAGRPRESRRHHRRGTHHRPQRRERRRPSIVDNESVNSNNFYVGVLRDPKVRAQVAKLKFHRPWFMLLLCFVFIGYLCYGLILSNGIVPMSENIMAGPSSDVLVQIGAKYALCSRAPYPVELAPLGISSMYDSYPCPATIATNNCTYLDTLEYLCTTADVPFSSGVPDQWWRFITPIFLHQGFIHLIIMIILHIWLGFRVERDLGFFRTMLIWLISGIAGNLMAMNLSPLSATMGSDGAMYGLFGLMYLDLFQNWPLLISPIKNFFFLTFAFLLALAIGLLPFIDNFSHIGGFIGGILAGLIFAPTITFGKWDGRRKLLLVILAVPLLFGYFFGFFWAFYKMGAPIDCPQCQYFDCVPAGTEWCSSYGST